MLRPPIAQERVELQPNGLVRLTLKKAYSDGTVAVDMDPLSLLGRGMTALEIRDFLTGEFEPVALEDVVAYLRAAEKAGTVKITERTLAPLKGAKPVKK